MHADPKNILALAQAFEEAELAQLHSGDREPGRDLNEKGKTWVVEGLRLLANSTVDKKSRG